MSAGRNHRIKEYSTDEIIVERHPECQELVPPTYRPRIAQEA
jgi:hypothetical protein